MKMLYVGMSRPTHLLCYASLKQNWNDERLQKMRYAGWQVTEGPQTEIEKSDK